MKTRLTLVLLSLFNICQIRPIEPVTLLGVSAFTTGALLRTTSGKIVCGIILGHMLKTEAGKKLLQNGNSFVWGKIQQSFPSFNKKSFLEEVSKLKEKAVNSQIVQNLQDLINQKKLENPLLAAKVQSFLDSRKADCVAARVWAQEKRAAAQEVFYGKSMYSESTKKASYSQSDINSGMNFTQNNVYNTANINNNGFFSRTYINDPTKTKEFADAKAEAARCKEQVNSYFWQGRYKGVKEGALGTAGAFGFAYWLFGSKKEKPVVLNVRPNYNSSSRFNSIREAGPEYYQFL